MRKALAVTALLFQPILVSIPEAQFHEPARVAWATPDPNYPLKLHMLSSERHGRHDHGIETTESYGSGNLLGPPELGFDYHSYCSGGFLHNSQADEFYQGRWKQPNAKIEILIVQTGSKHPEKCTVEVTMKTAAYTHDNPPPRLVTARN